MFQRMCLNNNNIYNNNNNNNNNKNNNNYNNNNNNNKNLISRRPLKIKNHKLKKLAIRSAFRNELKLTQSLADPP